MAIQKITSGIIQDGAVAAADIVSVANTAITGNIASSQIAPNQTLNGNVSVTGTLSASDGISVANTFGFKNRIINGGMVIDQRNAGASVTPTTAATGYPVDRFGGDCSVNSKYTLQQSTTAPTGFNYSLKVTSSSAYSVGAGDYFYISQVIEGYNVADLGFGTANAKTFTLSFWVQSSLTGTFGGSFRNGAGNRSYPFTYTILAANTWEQKSVTVAGDTSGTWITTNGAGLRVEFGLGVGTTYSGTAGSWAGATYLSATGATSVVGTNGATFYITGVQLEKGSTATSFDFRAYSTELALCQRYLPAFRSTGSNVPTRIGGSAYNATAIEAEFPFLVQSRVPPTGLVVSSGAHFASGDGITNITGINFTIGAVTDMSAYVYLTVASGLTTYRPSRIFCNTASGYFYFTGCEL